jgi:PAS domain S-box-containing protein
MSGPLDGLERDIHEQQRMESALSGGQQRYQWLYDNNPSMYFTLTPDGTVLSVNHFGAQQLGYGEHELIGGSVLEVFLPEDHRVVLSQLATCASHPHRTFEWELRKIRKDRTVIWVRERARAVTDLRGALTILVVCEDITEQRLTQEHVRESEERWRALFEHAGVGMSEVSLTGQFVRVNPRLCETLGYSSKTLLQRTIHDLAHPDELQSNQERLSRLINGSRPSFSVPNRYRRSDNTWVWVTLTVSLVRNGSGAPAYFIAVIEDISDRKQAEERLHQTTRFLRTLVRESPLPIVSLDLEARVTSWNQAATRLFGWSEEEVLGRELPYVPSGEEAAADVLWEKGTRNEVSGPVELRRRRKDGTFLDLLLWPVFVRDDTGTLTTAVGLYVDQSDLKRAEAARLSSEARLRSFLDALDDLAFEFDRLGTFLGVWTRNEDTLLLPKADIVGKRLQDLFGQEESARYLSIIQRVLETGQSESVEYSLPIKGHRRHFSAVLSPIPSVGGSTATVACVVRDITERILAEKALRDSEQRFSIAFRSSPYPVILTELESGRCLEANEAALELFGCRREEIVGLSTPGLALWPTQDERNGLLDRLRVEGCVRNREITLRTKDGTTRQLLVASEVIELNGLSCLLTVGNDITEQKRAAEARERLSQDLHDNILQALYAVGMQLEASRLVSGKSPRQAASYTAQAIGQLNQLVADVRRFIALIKLGAAPQTDFRQALLQLVHSFSTDGDAAAELTIDEDAVKLVPIDEAAQLLSIAREALSNSIRHARASRRWVRLDTTGTGVRLQIGDDGIGLDPERKRQQGQGLANMAARARTIRARFRLTSRPQKGTTVTIHLPRESHA